MFLLFYKNIFSEILLQANLNSVFIQLSFFYYSLVTLLISVVPLIIQSCKIRFIL